MENRQKILYNNLISSHSTQDKIYNTENMYMTRTEISPERGRIMGGFYNYEIIKKSDSYGYGIYDGIINGSMRRFF